MLIGVQRLPGCSWVDHAQLHQTTNQTSEVEPQHLNVQRSVCNGSFRSVPTEAPASSRGLEVSALSQMFQSV